MEQDFNFFKTTMPESRKADFYLGCHYGSVFIDFSYTTGRRIGLRRISFDGYGCCTIGEDTKSLDEQTSKDFVEQMNKDNLDQEKMTKIVLEAIRLNKDSIWAEALEEYEMI